MTRNLHQLATQLKEAPYFVGWTSSSPLIQKQMIFLVLSGDKLASNPIHFKEGGANQVDEIEKFLTDLGLHYKITVQDNDSLEAFISLDSHLPDLLKKTSDSPLLFGLLLGFPATAVQAFGDNTLPSKDLMEFDDERKLFEDAGLPYDDMPTFRLSKLHANEELPIIKRWWSTLANYDLV